ncbi:hypothetical protein [Pandoravirus japonicus]|uniref:Uncharacterized protein n=1 Tax=Pandoravirus japonicus TaxID=2823154 RepID=A0A811BP33_9VIRU|nr:hypothetical protein [Pandoravirus japonicus]
MIARRAVEQKSKDCTSPSPARAYFVSRGGRRALYVSCETDETTDKGRRVLSLGLAYGALQVPTPSGRLSARFLHAAPTRTEPRLCKNNRLCDAHTPNPCSIGRRQRPAKVRWRFSRRQDRQSAVSHEKKESAPWSPILKKHAGADDAGSEGEPSDDFDEAGVDEEQMQKSMRRAAKAKENNKPFFRCRDGKWIEIANALFTSGEH